MSQSKGSNGEKQQGVLPDPLTLLESAGRKQRLRPGQDFLDGRLWYGLPAGDHVVFVNSKREVMRADQLPGLTAVTRPDTLPLRFSIKGIRALIDGAREDGTQLLTDLERYFRRFAVYPHKDIPLLLSTWTLATYVHMVFRIFPYLILRSPVKRCGKSRVLDLLSLVCFNAGPKTMLPTPAQLFRGPAHDAGTVLLDEVENIGDKETLQALMGVLNTGFDRNGVVIRLEKDGDRFVPTQFPTYCPRALAGVSRMAESLEDRSIMIFMARRSHVESIERFSPYRLEAEVASLRDRCYIWALSHAEDVAQLYEGMIEEEEPLEFLDDRARDLWEPVVTVTLLADAEVKNCVTKPLTTRLVALARNLTMVRDANEEDTTPVLVIRRLEAILGGRDLLRIKPEDLRKEFQKQKWSISTKALADLLNPLGLYSHTMRDLEGGGRGRGYEITRAHLDDLRDRYGVPDEATDEAADEAAEEARDEPSTPLSPEK